MSSRLCKYHGRSCEFPGQCLNRAPRKYEGDGHLETIDPERLTIGCILRSHYASGALAAFSDTVVLGMYVSFSARRMKEEKKNQDKEHFLTLQEAMSEAKKDDYVYIKLGRPMMYADNAFGSIPSWALKCEVYETDAVRLTGSFKVVVMSTGENDTRNVKTPLRKWEVLVNGEKVFDDLSEDSAKTTYKFHRAMAQGAYGHKVGGKVTLLCDGKLDDEYEGKE